MMDISFQSLRSESLIAFDESFHSFSLKSYTENRKLLQDTEAVEDGESEECQVDAWSAIFWLFVLTIFISILSKNIVEAIEVS